MKKIFLISIFYIFFFCSNSFAFLEFKQSKDISSDTVAVRGINFNPDGTIMYITKLASDAINDTGEKSAVIQYSLSVPFDISTATKSFTTQLVGDGGSVSQMKLPHAIEFKPDGTKIFVTTNKNPTSVYQYKLTTPWDTSTLEYETIYNVDVAGGSSYTAQVRALAFKPDGTRMFIGEKIVIK